MLFEDMGVESLTGQSFTFKEPLLEESKVSQHWYDGGVGDTGRQWTDGQVTDNGDTGPEHFLQAPC